MLGSLFHEVLYRPLLNVLIALYDFLPGRDLGVAIIVLTVLVRLVLSPLLLHQFRSQKKLAALQPKLGEIRKATKDRAEQSRRTLELYKHHGVSPASGCFPLLVQLPILWAMYAALSQGLRPEALTSLYPIVPNPGVVHPISFGILHLGQAAFHRVDGQLALSLPAIILALLTGIVTYWQTRLTPGVRGHTIAEDATPQEQMAHRMNRQMLLIMPLMTTYFALTFPAGLSLYWFVTTLVSVVQQRYLTRST